MVHSLSGPEITGRAGASLYFVWRAAALAPSARRGRDSASSARVFTAPRRGPQAAPKRAINRCLIDLFASRRRRRAPLRYAFDLSGACDFTLGAAA